MPESIGYQELVARELRRQVESRGAAVARQLGPPVGSRPLTDEQELDHWDFSDPSIDVDAQLLDGVPIEAVTRAKFPHRERLIKSGGRTTRTQQVEYAERMAKRSLVRQARQLVEVLQKMHADGHELPPELLPIATGRPAPHDESQVPDGAAPVQTGPLGLPEPPTTGDVPMEDIPYG